MVEEKPKLLVCECGNNIFFVCLDGDVLCTNCSLIQDLEVSNWERQSKNVVGG